MNFTVIYSKKAETHLDKKNIRMRVGKGNVNLKLGINLRNEDSQMSWNKMITIVKKMLYILLEKCVQNPEISAAVANSSTTESDIHIEGSEEGKKTDNEVTVCDKDNLENEPPYRSREEDPAVLNVDYNDSASWPSDFDDNFRIILTKKGPHQISKYDFPKDIHKRRFTPTYYKRILPNGEEVCRSWLVYSIKCDSVFCFCCKLFQKKNTSVLQTSGSRDWKNIGAILSSHERNSYHLENYNTWRELNLRLSNDSTIDSINQQNIKQEKKHWHQILERLIALIRVLGTQNLALRGTTERLYSINNGNLLKFVKYLAIFDPVMNEHLRRVKNQETMVHYLGKDIQNELIQILSNAIKNKILSSIKLAKYYSIILDCTPDVSHVEQMTMIARFVDLSSNKVVIKENFLCFVPMEKTTGASMTEILLDKLKEMELPVENIRGQGYDNGSNMKGKENGVQKRLLEINPRAFFVPCSAHTLNLVVNDSSKCCLDATNFFGLVQQIYNFFPASTQRWQVLSNHIINFSLKGLCETRWESRIDALKPLRYNLGEIYDSLLEIFDDPKLNTLSGNSARIEAKVLADAICKYKFMVSLVTWYNILFEVNIASKVLQEKDDDITSTTEQLKVTKKYLVQCRCDEEYEKVLVDAAELAKEQEIEPKFDIEVRRRRKKKLFDYESSDEALQDPKQKFKVEFYYPVLDMAIQSIEERFEQLEQHNALFGFLYDIYNSGSRKTEDLLSDCKKFEEALTYNNNNDIDANDLCNELYVVARRLPKSIPPIEVLAFIIQQKMVDCVPNVYIALRILLTLPVSVASGDRSFSKLKLIKSYLRSTMSQNKLVDLATISIECDKASKLDLRELVVDFAKRKARKIKF